MKYFNFKDKKAIILTIIAIVTLLSLLIGATYAYFIASESLLTTSRTLEVTTNENVSVVATGNTTLSMDLNLDDMRKFGVTKTYYATQNGKSEIDTKENFINIESNSSTGIYCTYTAVLTNNNTEGKSNMIDQIYANGKDSELVLETYYNDTLMNQFDMKTTEWDNNKIEFTGILSDIEPLGSANLDVLLYLKNLSDVDQAPYLANSALNLNLGLKSINCDTMDAPKISSIAINSNNYSAIDVVVEEGNYQLRSYCVDKVEKNLGDCNWIANSDNEFTVDLGTLGLPDEDRYYLHVKDTRGYIADSTGFDVNLSAISRTFTYVDPGVAQEFTVPVSTTYKIELWGSGNIYPETNQEATGHGAGAYTSGYITLNQGDKLYFYVGAEKNTFNGGAEGGVYQGGPTYVQEYNAYGNGATDVRIVNGIWSENTSLISRIMVAGAGGRGNGYILGKTYGASISQGDYGYAGGLYGYAGMVNKEQSSSHTRYVPYPGLAGTQISGGAGGINNYNGQYGTAGSFGKGGAGGSGANSWGSNTYTWSTGYGGSGGWYGSGGSGGNNAGWWSAAGTGGGSSYISGHTGCVTVTSISSSSPKSGCSSGTTNRDCSKHPNGYVFNDTLMIDGAGFKWTNIKAEQVQMPNPEGGYYQLGKGHSGNGYARISTGEKDAIKIY